MRIKSITIMVTRQATSTTTSSNKTNRHSHKDILTVPRTDEALGQTAKEICINIAMAMEKDLIRVMNGKMSTVGEMRTGKLPINGLWKCGTRTNLY